MASALGPAIQRQVAMAPGRHGKARDRLSWCRRRNARGISRIAVAVDRLVAVPDDPAFEVRHPLLQRAKRTLNHVLADVEWIAVRVASGNA